MCVDDEKLLYVPYIIACWWWGPCCSSFVVFCVVVCFCAFFNFVLVLCLLTPMLPVCLDCLFLRFSLSFNYVDASHISPPNCKFNISELRRIHGTTIHFRICEHVIRPWRHSICLFVLSPNHTAILQTSYDIPDLITGSISYSQINSHGQLW